MGLIPQGKTLKMGRVRVAGLALVLAGATGAGAVLDFERDSLKGLPGVVVLVEDLPTVATALGITKSSIQTAVELRLRQYGVRVMSDAENARTDSEPVFYVQLNVLRDSTGTSAYKVEVSLNQRATLANGYRSPGVTTWSISLLGYVGAAAEPAPTIRAKLMEQVDAFINDFLAANPQVKVPSPRE